MRALAASLAVLAALALILALGAISQIWDEYGDSPDSLYLDAGGKMGAIAVVLAAGAWLAWRWSGRSSR